MSSPIRSPERAALLNEEKEFKASRTAYLDRINRLTNGLKIATALTEFWPGTSRSRGDVMATSEVESLLSSSPLTSPIRAGRRSRAVRWGIVGASCVAVMLVAAPWAYKERMRAVMAPRPMMGFEQVRFSESITSTSFNENAPDPRPGAKIAWDQSTEHSNEDIHELMNESTNEHALGSQWVASSDSERDLEGSVSVQHTEQPSADDKSSSRDPEMLDFIRNMIRHAWKGYVTYAAPHDELSPLSRTGRDWHTGGSLAMTAVDSLDTLWIAGLKKEYEEAREIVEALKFDIDSSVSFFETTIRHLGGLLSAHSLTTDPLYVHLAHSLGLRLLHAVDSVTGLAGGAVNLKTGAHSQHEWLSGMVGTAETGTYALEFLHLYHLTNDTRFYDAVQHLRATLAHLRTTTPTPGIWSDRIDPHEKRVLSKGRYNVGGGVDSFYEYLVKVGVWAGLGLRDGKETSVDGMTWTAEWRDMYEESVDAILANLATNYTRSSDGASIAFLPAWTPPSHETSMEHLSCFFPGMLVLGLRTSPHNSNSTASGARNDRILDWAKAVTEGCVRMYSEGVAGIAPENGEMQGDRIRPAGWGPSQNTKYILRPETLESLFVLYRHTHDPIYRRWARDILFSIERECRVDTGGYAGLIDVGRPTREGGRSDGMESFFIAETLKYGYLIFEGDEVVSLEDWVFNTEAHPLRIPVRPDRGTPSFSGHPQPQEMPVSRLELLRTFRTASLSVRPDHRTPELLAALAVCENELQPFERCLAKKLPPELLDILVKDMCLNDLKTMSVVCRQWSASAKKKIWSVIDISNPGTSHTALALLRRVGHSLLPVPVGRLSIVARMLICNSLGEPEISLPDLNGVQSIRFKEPLPNLWDDWWGSREARSLALRRLSALSNLSKVEILWPDPEILSEGKRCLLTLLKDLRIRTLKVQLPRLRRGHRFSDVNGTPLALSVKELAVVEVDSEGVVLPTYWANDHHALDVTSLLLSFQNLRSLIVRGNFIIGRDGSNQKPFGQLLGWTKLNNLDININRVSDFDLSHLLSYIVAECSTSLNRLGFLVSTYRNVLDIWNPGCVLSNLSELSLGVNSNLDRTVSDGELFSNKFCDFLARCPNISSLTLRGIPILDQGIISNIATSCPSIKCLVLSEVSWLDVANVVSNLPLLRFLRVIGLKNENINGPPAAVETLISHQHLRRFDVLDTAYLLETVNIFTTLCRQYFGLLDDSTVKSNFVLIYELLDEIVDFGLPQSTDHQTLSLYITTESIRSERAMMEDAKQITLQATGAISWRRPDIKYRKNEAFVDVIEGVNLLMSNKGTILRSDVSGQILMRAYLSGVPECKLGINERLLDNDPSNTPRKAPGPSSSGVELDDVQFHQCVRLGRFDSDRTISFVPPDGEFELMRYRTTDSISLPFRVTPHFSQPSTTTAEYRVHVRSMFSPKVFAQNVVVRVPTPTSTANVKLVVGGGKAKYVGADNCVVWKIARFPGATDIVLTFTCELSHTTAGKGGKAWSRPPISMDFQVLMYTASGLLVRFLKVFEKGSYESIKVGWNHNFRSFE
ncbi:hypothetical protein HDU93_006114 [Gonapodya sp. JEL0774]|nr:hypothetical protein HDU93_006114 [Gonapodya sp. JEL0774]